MAALRAKTTHKIIKPILKASKSVLACSTAKKYPITAKGREKILWLILTSDEYFKIRFKKPVIIN